MSSDDPYLYPNTDVLINKLGIRDKATLADAENSLSAIRVHELAQTPVKGNFDYDHLRAIHKQLFSDTYPWAGDPRHIGISKPEEILNGQTVNYPHPDHPHPPDNLNHRAEYIFSQLKKDNYLRNLEPDAFVEKLTHHMSELWKLHPFRDGNTRAVTAFIEQMCKEAGYDMKPTAIEQAGKLRDALALATKGKTEGLHSIINNRLGFTKNIASLESEMRIKDPASYARYQVMKKMALDYSKQASRQPDKQQAIHQSIVDKAMEKYQSTGKLPSIDRSKSKTGMELD